MLTQEWNTQTYGEVRFSEGVSKERHDSARRMLADNLPLEQVAKFTLIPLDQLRLIQKEDNHTLPNSKPKLL